MAPASDNNNQDLATKKAKLDSNTVINNVGKYFFFCINKTQKYYNDDENPERINDTQTQNSDTIKIN